MRLAILTAHSQEGEVQHRYVVDRLVDVFGDQVISIIVATGLKKSPARKIQAWLKRYSLSQIVSRIAVQLVRRIGGDGARRQAVYRSILFPGDDSGRMPGGEKVVRIRSHNSVECRQLLNRLKPDIVVVYGTLVLGRKLIEAAPPMLNLHTGLSPSYRGSDTIFWPLHNGETDMMGVTVHRLDPGIDSGPILARGRPQIAATDGEDEIFAKSVILGVALLCRAVVRVFEGTAHPVEQRLDQGREYRSVDRTLAADRRMRQQLAAGALTGGLDSWREEF